MTWRGEDERKEALNLGPVGRSKVVRLRCDMKLVDVVIQKRRRNLRPPVLRDEPEPSSSRRCSQAVLSFSRAL